MTKREFIESPEWQILAARITKIIDERVLQGYDISIASDFPAVRYIGGYVAGLRDVLLLPDQLLHDEDEKPKVESLELANRPRPHTQGRF